ncbi:MAG: tetratricopeptide repeat protein, partial [Gammaproteobacteria bacterium]|nr:tetratricopeptide repeat protein [Gammaproteobacteria bacterium]
MSETIEQLQRTILPLIQNQQLDEALEITREACKRDPKNADKWLLQASTYSYKKNMPMLEYCCQKAIALQPRHVGAHYNLAVARQVRGDLAAAEKGFNSVIQLQPQHANAHAALAQILRIQHRFEDALKHQQQAISLMPDNPQLHFQIAVLYQNTRQIELAIQHYKEILKILPEHLEALNNLGSLYHSQGQLNQSIQYFSQALKIQPDNAQLHYNMSQANWQLANIEQSLQFALRALQLEEDNLLYRQNFIQALAAVENIPNSTEVIKQIEKSYNVEGVSWQNILGPSLAVLRQQAEFSRLRDKAILDDYDFIHRFINTDESDQLLNSKLLLHCLTHTVITFEHDEQLFTLLRRALLNLAIEKNYVLKNHQIALIAALACQCFNNEYAFAQSEDEISKINDLT